MGKCLESQVPSYWGCYIYFKRMENWGERSNKRGQMRSGIKVFNKVRQMGAKLKLFLPEHIYI